MPARAGAEGDLEVVDLDGVHDEGEVQFIHRTLRVPEPLWHAALAAAKQERTTASDEMRKALERLVKRAERRAAGGT